MKRTQNGSRKNTKSFYSKERVDVYLELSEIGKTIRSLRHRYERVEERLFRVLNKEEQEKIQEIFASK